MGEGIAVTYATAPEKITDNKNDQIVLHREGNPVFFASAPMGKSGGSILFTPDNGYYHSSENWTKADDNFAFEVWVKARLSDKTELDAKQILGVASIGAGKFWISYCAKSR